MISNLVSVDLLNDEGRKVKPGQADDFYKTYLASKYDESKVADEALLNLNKNKPKAKHVKG